MNEHLAEKDAPVYEWDVNVRRHNTYGDRVESTTPAVILAATKSGVTTKVRAMFEAKYDDFRKFWSHDWTLNSVREIPRVPPPAETIRRVHDHAPYRPVCNERDVDGQLRGACLNDDGTSVLPPGK